MLDAHEASNILVSGLVLGFAFGNLFGLSFLSFIQFTIFSTISLMLYRYVKGSVSFFFGSSSRYRLWLPGVFLSLLSSFFGIVFAVPGFARVREEKRLRWVRSEPHLRPKHLGFIGSFGPVAFILLGVVSMAMASLTSFEVFSDVAKMNFWMSLSFLFPYPYLDGGRLLMWSRIAWGLAVVTAFTGLVVSYLI